MFFEELKKCSRNALREYFAPLLWGLKKLRHWEIRWHRRRLEKLGVNVYSESEFEKKLNDILRKRKREEQCRRFEIAREYFYEGGGDPLSPNCPKMMDFVRW